MIKACIFDLDGTLADTLESMAYVLTLSWKNLVEESARWIISRYYSGEDCKRCAIAVHFKDAEDPAELLTL